MGNKEEDLIKRLVCKIFFNFNNNFNIIINIDCYLIPFDFKFEVYDYNNKSFNNSIDLYLKGYEFFIKNNKSKKIIPKLFPLHFQVILPNFPYKGKVEFSTSKSNYIKIENNTIPKEFKNNFTFDLELNIDNNIISINNQTRRKYLNETSFLLTLKLNNRTYDININLKLKEKFIQKEKYNIEYINKFNFEKYSMMDKKENWTKVSLKNFEKKYDYNSTHVSIFGYEPSIYIEYNGQEKYNKDFLELSTSENHLLIIKISKVFLWWGTDINYYISNNSQYYYDN